MMARVTKQGRLFWCGVVILTLLIGAVVAVRATGLVSNERIEAYHAPIYSSDNRSVYFVRRNAEGLAWGLGIEHFTPPASIRIDNDRIALCRLDLATGQTEVLQSWGQMPTTGQTFKSYRGSLFQVFRAQLSEPIPGFISYRFLLTIHKVPSAEQYLLTGLWPNSEETGSDWSTVVTQVAVPEADLMVKGQHELLTLPTNRLYPSALVEHDHAHNTTKILQQSPAFSEHYPEGIPPEEIRSSSRHAETLRLRNMKTTHQQLLEKFGKEGLKEGDAAMAAIDEMRRLGYYPKPTTITAEEIPAGYSDLENIPQFEIADAEMASGVFPDIEKALVTPGTAVEKSMGQYIIHRDYQNSRKLNSLLDEGGKQFRIRYKGQHYLISIHNPGEDP
jgi:hypothetical protein